ncbi:MAG: Alpha-D-glucose-1-phosphate phosphatase YihX [Candidatus Omnitrophica bacterium ADurb.Bin277]|nr:MAG: Alpha-D-glucose-1-phosphate phosphatase YihX [Candidatus Omnitrophica bacterium ADurb.Bin277]
MEKKSLRVKAVIFDLGNVLVNYDAKKAARRFSEAGGISQTRIWAHFFLSRFEKAYTCGEISTREFYLEACRVFKKPVPFSTFKHYWNDIFWENPGMEKLLKRLKRHYPLYLISNTNRLHFTHIKREFKLLRHFKRMFPSHEVGARKPDLEIYRRVLKKIGLRPEETVFVDDMKSFIMGARKAGMRAIRFRGLDRLLKDLRSQGVRF